MSLTDLHRLSATDAARLIRDGAISSLDLVEACLARVREVDDRVEAWAFLDPDHARAQARAADEWRMSGQPTGSLHGVPVGLKDIIDYVLITALHMLFLYLHGRPTFLLVFCI